MTLDERRELALHLGTQFRDEVVAIARAMADRVPVSMSPRDALVAFAEAVEEIPIEEEYWLSDPPTGQCPDVH